MRYLAFLLLGAIPSIAQSAGTETLTHEAMWMMKRVGAPAASPDGKWVVFSVTEPSYESEKQVSDLWIVPADGSSEPRRLTSTRGGESGAAWSPDSRRIAFSARREGDEKNQIYVLDTGGGEAVRVTSLAMGASSPAWSPDGRRLLFESEVFPGAAGEEANGKIAEERKNRKYDARVYEGFPIRYWDRWLEDSFEHILIQAPEAGAEARDLLAGTQAVARPGFRPARGNSGASFDPVWAPDGQSVIFSANVNDDAAAHSRVVAHLFRVPAAGGEPRDLTPGPDSYSKPRFAPDGGTLYALRAASNEFNYNVARLAAFRWPSPGEAAILSAGFDRSIDAYSFAPDSRTVYLQAEDEGSTKLFAMPAGGGPVRPIVEAPEGTYSGLAAGERAPSPVVVAVWQSSRHPAEIARIDPVARTHRFLTGFNKEAAARIDAQPARQFRFTSKRGRRIHNLLFLPPKFDERKKYPLVVFIHGGAHNMSTDDFHFRWNYLLLASPGYVVLTTNYTGSSGFGEQFARAIQGDPLRTPGEEINEAVDEAIRRFPFVDGTRLAAGGASYGGHLSNWLQATTTRFRCLYSHAGLISLEGQWATSDTIYHREIDNGGAIWGGSPVWREQSPMTYASAFKTPVLLTIGVNDYRVPLNQTLAYWSLLKRLEVPSRLIVFPRANHWIQNAEDSRFFWGELLGWLKKYLGAAG